MRAHCVAFMLPCALASAVSAAPLTVVSNLPADRFGLTCSESCTVAAGSATALGGDRVLFESRSPNLVPNDLNGTTDLFLRERSSGTTQLVSGLTGTMASQLGAFSGALAAGGQHVAFLTGGNHLDAGDVNGVVDVYVRDLANGSFDRVSAAIPGGFEIANVVGPPAISGDGRYVAFQTFSPLTPDDVPGFDAFVRDRSTAALARISIGPDGTTAPGEVFLQSMSDDGRFVAMASGQPAWRPVGDPSGTYFSIYVHDRELGVTRAISNRTLAALSEQQGAPAVRAGKVLVQVSATSTRPFAATDVCGIALVDAVSLASIAVPVSGAPATGSTCSILDLSSDAQAVLVSTSAALSAQDLNSTADLYVVDVASGVPSLATRDPGGLATGYRTLSPAAFVRGSRDVVFSRSRDAIVDFEFGIDSTFVASAAGAVEVGLAQPPARASALFFSTLRNLGISDDGNFLLAETGNPKLLRETWFQGYTRVVRIDRRDGAAVVANRLPDGSFTGPDIGFPSMSGDGRHVAFETTAMPGATRQVYVRDLQAGTTAVLSRTGAGTPGNGNSSYPVISRDGRWVVYWTAATNLAGNPGSGLRLIVLADRVTSLQVRVAAVADGPVPFVLGVDRDGRRVVFTTTTALVPGDNDGLPDVHVYERETGSIRLVSRRGAAPDDAAGYVAAISPDGRFVAFESDNLQPGTRYFLADVDGGGLETIELRSPFVPGELNGPMPPVLSDQARSIIYTPYLEEPRPEGGSTAEVVRYDRTTRRVAFLSARPDGSPSGGRCDVAHISADGRFVLFESTARGLAEGDLNGRDRDLVLWDADQIFLFEDGFEPAAPTR